MADLTTVETVKQWIGIDVDTDDLLLARLVSAVSTWVEKYVGRTISEDEYVEYYTCWGERSICLNNYPVTEVTLVEVDGEAVDESTEYGTEGWTLDGSTLRFNGGTFSYRGNTYANNVHIEYSAGYTTTPYDLEQAVIHLVALRYRERDRVGVKSKSAITGETIQFSSWDLPPDVKQVLDGYKAAA